MLLTQSPETQLYRPDLPAIDDVPVGIPSKDGEVEWITWDDLTDHEQYFPEMPIVVGERVEGSAMREVMSGLFTNQLRKKWADPTGYIKHLPFTAKQGQQTVETSEILRPVEPQLLAGAAAILHLGGKLTQAEVNMRSFRHREGLPPHVDFGVQNVWLAMLIDRMDDEAEEREFMTHYVTDEAFTELHADNPNLRGNYTLDDEPLDLSDVDTCTTPSGYVTVFAARSIHFRKPLPKDLVRPSIRQYAHPKIP